MNYDAAILSEIARRGKQPGKITTQEMRSIALGVRQPREKLQAVVSAAETRLAVATKPDRRVSLFVLERRAAGCRACDKFQVLAEGQPACLLCGCSGKDLRAKWRDKTKRCPKEPPVWTEEP